MRLRNVKNKEVLDKSPYIVNEPFSFKGRWKEVFKNNNPIYLEIGMGKGQFLINMALNNPNINFIGIEKFDSVMVRTLEKMENYKLTNIKVIKIDAIDILEVFDNEISKIYLNFSDPWPKRRHSKKRLTSEVFLEKYNQLGNLDIEQKTDNRKLFEYSLQSFVNNNYKILDLSLDLHNDKENIITTEYEDKFTKRNQIIYYINVKK
jgi:tRNA (guanine-N(7)-)-methyltransferase